MSIVTTDSSNFAGIADAIRAKGVQGTFKPREMAAAIEGIQGAVDISDAIVVKARNADGCATEIDFYGSAIYPNTFGSNTTYTDSRKTAYSEVTAINWKNPISEVMHWGFLQGFNGMTNIELPKNPCVFNAECFGRSQSRITAANFPGGGILKSECFRQWSGLVSITLGSVGFPITNIQANSIFAYDTDKLTNIELFCTGENADDFLAKCRNGATAATITIRACEDTSYNGVPCSAGSIMITSNP